jgi:beta-galactosidase
MVKGKNALFFLLIMLITVPITTVSAQVTGREVLDFDYGWKFYKGDIQRGQDTVYDDAGWRIVDLPHDWSIEGPFSNEFASCTAYLPGGIGWYRKNFVIPYKEKGKEIFLSFAGIYNNSEVWINGHFLGERPNGYISFQYDITPFISYEKQNLVAVRVDHSQYADSRWYTGSGIYRDVKIVFSSPVHIANWGVFAKTENVNEKRAVLSVETKVRNELSISSFVTVYNFLLSGTDTVARAQGKLKVMPDSESLLKQEMKIDNPHLWDIDDPFLYSLVTVVKGNDNKDNITTAVGFRGISVDPDRGLFINGRNIKLKGICMHHAAGTLGAAVPRKVTERRLDILKEMGCNAIRTSHNPFSPEFLDLCDEKGFLVIDEAFDEWELPKKKWIKGWNKGVPGKEGYSEYFRKWHGRDLADMIRRDRNHPSVIMYSIGNEIDYPDDPYTHPVLDTEANPQTWAKYNPSLPNAERLGIVARELVSTVKEYDDSRPVTAGLASALMSNVTGYADALDVVGYNYQEYRYEEDHRKYPERILYGSENGMSLEAWETVEHNDYVMGQFLWTGFDYLGEAGQFPDRNSTSGLIDLAGNKKPEYYFRQSLWSKNPMVYVATTAEPGENKPAGLWDHKKVYPVWNYDDGEKINVEVFTNCDDVTLYLNNKSLGTKRMKDFKERVLSWIVPFQKGTLRAVASSGGRNIATYDLKTSGEPVKLTAESDVRVLKADRKDVAHITVKICDRSDNEVYSAGNEVTCEVSGPVRLLGMEDSNSVNTENYRDNRQHAFHGRLLIYIQSTDKPGKAKIKIASQGLRGTEVDLVSK